MADLTRSLRDWWAHLGEPKIVYASKPEPEPEPAPVDALTWEQMTEALSAIQFPSVPHHATVRSRSDLYGHPSRPDIEITSDGAFITLHGVAPNEAGFRVPIYVREDPSLPAGKIVLGW